MYFSHNKQVDLIKTNFLVHTNHNTNWKNKQLFVHSSGKQSIEFQK